MHRLFEQAKRDKSIIPVLTSKVGHYWAMTTKPIEVRLTVA